MSVKNVWYYMLHVYQTIKLLHNYMFSNLNKKYDLFYEMKYYYSKIVLRKATNGAWWIKEFAERYYQWNISQIMNAFTNKLILRILNILPKFL